MTLHADATRILDAWVAPSSEQESLRRSYLDHLGHHADAMQRSCHPDHLTASSLVFSHDRARVLLTLHKKLGRWLQTGGHCEDSDTSLAAAALREGIEETGIADLTIDPRPVLLSRHELPCGPITPAHHLDVQFVAVAPADAAATMSDESTDLQWFDIEALPNDTDDSVRALVSACATRLQEIREHAPSSDSD